MTALLIDALIIAVYFVAIICIGLYMGRREKTLHDFELNAAMESELGDAYVASTDEVGGLKFSMRPTRWWSVDYTKLS